MPYLTEYEEALDALTQYLVPRNTPMPAPVYRAGDLVTIRLSEADAYELGCGAEAKPSVVVSAIIKHEPVPPPYTECYTFYSKRGNNSISNSAAYARSNFSKGFIGHLEVTIDPSKPEGQRITFVEIAP